MSVLFLDCSIMALWRLCLCPGTREVYGKRVSPLQAYYFYCYSCGPRDTQRVSQEREKALKNEQKRQKCGYLRENPLFADFGRSGSKGSHMPTSCATRWLKS